MVFTGLIYLYLYIVYFISIPIIDIYNLSYGDEYLISFTHNGTYLPMNPSIIFTNDNVFGAVRKTKKGYSLDSKKVPNRPYHSDLMQMSLYKKMCNKIPALIYASNVDWKCFTPDNCEELQDKNLDIHFKELVTIQKTWQTKLQIANGDVKKLASMIKPDFSNIRKKDFWWETVPAEYIKKFKRVYDC